MAIFRNVHLSFWTDPKVQDDFTPEDRYFYLYLLTNPHTNLVGCYEISIKQMSDETGYTRDCIERLIRRLSECHNVIRYSNITKELLVINWHKYNWTESETQKRAIYSQASKIKDSTFRELISDSLCIRYGSGMDTTDTDTDIYNVIKEDNKDTDIDIIKSIVIYLNKVCGTRYRHGTESTKKCIRARLREGFTEEDFFEVIDKKHAQWGNDPKMMEYLRPETLFSAKHFESYLNQRVPGGVTHRNKPDDPFSGLQ